LVFWRRIRGGDGDRLEEEKIGKIAVDDGMRWGD
jgi:hypothetical protein